MQQYTVVSDDGEFIATCSLEERNRLIGCTEAGSAPRYGAPDRLFPGGVPEYNQRLIRQASYKSSRLLYFAIVDPSIIRAELRRHISPRVPTAEDNVTVTKVSYAGDDGFPVRYFEYRESISFGYPTTEASANEHYERIFGKKPIADEHKALLIPFPLPPSDLPPTAA